MWEQVIGRFVCYKCWARCKQCRVAAPNTPNPACCLPWLWQRPVWCGSHPLIGVGLVALSDLSVPRSRYRAGPMLTPPRAFRAGRFETSRQTFMESIFLFPSGLSLPRRTLLWQPAPPKPHRAPSRSRMARTLDRHQLVLLNRSPASAQLRRWSPPQGFHSRSRFCVWSA